MDKKKIINNLIIANLILIFLYLLGKFTVVSDFIKVIIGVVITPILFGVFLFYILKPLNDIFIRKGMKTSRAAALTLFIAGFILTAVFKYFGEYLILQVMQLKEMIINYIEEEQVIGMATDYINGGDFKSLLNTLSTGIIDYVALFINNAKNIFDKGMVLFSDIMLIILITFFLLKDGHEFKSVILRYCPKKYKEVLEVTLPKCNDVLSTYIIGQAVVALSLSIMVLIGYKVIGMPGGLLLAFITFILAFIPFVGFFISMIVPYIVAIIMGLDMVIKLSVLFVIAQTLKGRVVVPFIMGKAMKIHPITDIFLVVGGAAVGGTIVAFSIVPIYALLKVIYKSFREGGYIKVPYVDKINKV